MMPQIGQYVCINETHFGVVTKVSDYTSSRGEVKVLVSVRMLHNFMPPDQLFYSEIVHPINESTVKDLIILLRKLNVDNLTVTPGMIQSK